MLEFYEYKDHHLNVGSKDPCKNFKSSRIIARMLQVQESSARMIWVYWSLLEIFWVHKSLWEFNEYSDHW